MRAAGILLAGLLVLGLLVTLAVLLGGAQDDAVSAEKRRFSERAALSATLTSSLFAALGTSSGQDLERRFGGRTPALRRALAQRLESNSDVGYLAIVDAQGRTLARAGHAPERLALRPAQGSGPLLSDVVETRDGRFVEFAVPFGRGEDRRALVQAVSLRKLTAFLYGYFAQLSQIDGSALELTDRNGVVLTRHGPADSEGGRSDGDPLSAVAAVPGTNWRLRLEADRDRVLAGVEQLRWMPWLLLLALGVAAVAGLRFYSRMRSSVRSQHAAFEALNESRDQISNLVEALEEGVVLHHRNGETELLNSSAHELLGTDAHVLRGAEQGWRVLDRDGISIADRDWPIHRVLNSGHPARDVVGLERRDGTCRWLAVRARPLFRAGEEEPHAVVASFTDVSEERALEVHLTELAERDTLTGVWNRRRFEEDLARQVARCRRYGETAALLLLDIDGFKQVNDTLGHLAGDDVLRALGDALGRLVRASDSAGRLGGDEFGVLLLDVDETGAREAAAGIRARLTSFVAGHFGSQVGVAVSIGMTMLHARSLGAAEALADADADMYAEKRRHGLAPVGAVHAPRAGTDRREEPEPSHAASLRALLTAVQARDSYTAGHSREVVTLARAVARRLGLGPEEIGEVEIAALLHDLGKIAMPDAILRKPGPLTATEQLLMRQHPIVGAQMVSSIPELEHLAPAIRAEHERWDGNGYPDGLAGADIPIASRITFVCDAYHAMTSTRPYRRALSREAAMLEIARNAGGQFCPDAARELLAVLRVEGGAAHGVRVGAAHTEPGQPAADPAA